MTVIQTWEPNAADLQERLLNMAHTGARLILMILQPNGDAAKQRSHDLGHATTDYVRNQIQGNIDEFSTFAKTHNLVDSLEIRCFTSPPPFALYLSSGTAYVGFYWRLLQSVQGPQLIIDPASALGGRLSAYAERILSESVRVFPPGDTA